MGGDALFWIVIIVLAVVMFGAFFLLDRPRRSGSIPTKLSGHTDLSDPRGRHQPADPVDPSESSNRL